MLAGWRADPTVLAGLGLAAALYALAAGPWRRRLPGSAPLTTAQALCFALAVGVFALALESPLDDLADDALFSVHMGQHLLLVLVVPALALAGIPGWMLRPLLCRRRIATVVRLLTHPLVAFALANGVFALAHLPAVFDWVQGDEAAHALEHLLFLASGLLLWWPVLSPLPEFPRLSHPMQMGYLFLQTLPCNIVGALLTLAGGPLYAAYAQAARPEWITAAEDQQVGGLLMWIGASLYYFLAMALVFFAWAGREEGGTSLPDPLPSAGRGNAGGETVEIAAARGGRVGVTGR